MTEPSQYFKGRTVQEQMNEVIGYVDTRSAEVAVNAIAADVAQVHQDMLDADADASAAAASAAAAAGTLANAVKKTGEVSQSIDGDIDLNDDLNVDGDATIGGALGVTGDITGNNASLIGTVTVPTETTGQFTMKAVNSTKLKNELDNYPSILRNVDNKFFTGNMVFVGNGQNGATTVNDGFAVKVQTLDVTAAPGTSVFSFMPCITDTNNKIVAGIRVQVSSSNKIVFSLVATKSDGATLATKTLWTYDKPTDTWS